MPERTDDGTPGDGRPHVPNRGSTRRGRCVVGAGYAAGDRPDRYEIDLTGMETAVPRLGERLRVTRGTWVVTEDSQPTGGDCHDYRFQFHYRNGLTVEGLDTGRVWTGQSPESRSLTVCPPYPTRETVTHWTTATADEEDRPVQYRFTGQLTVDADGDWTASYSGCEFGIDGTETN